MRRCQYEADGLRCQNKADTWVESRKFHKVLYMCYDHAKIVVDEGSPEYTVDCPHCGCLIPVN